MSGRRILIAGSVPLAAPWNGADKNFARLLVEFDRANQYVVQTGPNDDWPEPRVRPIRWEKPSAMPTPGQKVRAAAFMARYGGTADLLHVVASLDRPSPRAADVLRLWRAGWGKPVLHTVPSIGDQAPDSRHFAGDLTVVVSEHTRRSLINAGVHNVVRTYPPLDDRKLRRTRDQVARAYVEFELGTRAVLYPAHYGPDSGIREMIWAFSQLPADLADAVLVLACRTYVGQDPEREAEKVRTWAAEAGIGERVRATGGVKDMPALIEACAVTALVPARLGSKMDLPLVVLEALALGRPVVITDRPPMNEARLGEGGFVVPFGDPEVLSRALTRLLRDRDLRERLGAQGRSAVLRQCNPEQVAQRYQEFYDLAADTRFATRRRGHSQINHG